VTVRQRWSQEPEGFNREAILKLPQVLPADGTKLPLVVDLHGNGGQGNVRRLSFLGESVVVVAPNGYQRSWNVYNEKSKADDVSFILDLIKKVVEENPVVDRSDVTIMGTSNGAAMIYRLLLETGRDRPFHRVIPIASSLISVQHHDNQFWKSESGNATDHSMPVRPQFDDNFQFLHFHGTDDGTIAYWGKSPGPSFLGANVDVLPAQRTDFLFARAMGSPGRQEADDAGEVVGELQVYSYLGGRVKHFKHVGGTHGNTLGNAQIKEEIKKAIIGAA
jgi:poly(3-hydroxybutyrate) depolymerase